MFIITQKAPRRGAVMDMTSTLSKESHYAAKAQAAHLSVAQLPKL